MKKHKENDKHETSPSYQDKEERRIITLESMKDLLKFHEIERQEKNNTLKFYSAFIVGGIALVLGITKLDLQGGVYVVASIKFVSTSVIIIINYLLIKKLLAVRIASNNIYREYGERLEYLISHHRKDLDDDELCRMKLVFNKYFGTPKDPTKLLPKYSADRHEIYGLWFINLFFSLSYILPLRDLYFELKGKYKFNDIYFEYSYLIGFCLALEALVVLWGLYIIQNAKNSPGYGSRADE